jgi:hypothetical protein
MIYTENTAWAGKKCKNILIENQKGRAHLGDLGAKGKIILKCILKYSLRVWNGFEMCRIGSYGGLL